VETNLVDGVSGSGFPTTSVISVLRMVDMFWSTDKYSYNSLFRVASENMEAEQSVDYIEIFGRSGEPWWQSSPAKHAKLAEKIGRV
jgi:hypothetical protein